MVLAQNVLQEIEAENECIKALQAAVEQARVDGNSAALEAQMQRASAQLSGLASFADTLDQTKALLADLKEAEEQVCYSASVWVTSGGG